MSTCSGASLPLIQTSTRGVWNLSEAQEPQPSVQSHQLQTQSHCPDPQYCLGIHKDQLQDTDWGHADSHKSCICSLLSLEHEPENINQSEDSIWPIDQSEERNSIILANQEKIIKLYWPIRIHLDSLDDSLNNEWWGHTLCWILSIKFPFSSFEINIFSCSIRPSSKSCLDFRRFSLLARVF